MARALLVTEYDDELPKLPPGYTWSIIRPREGWPTDGYLASIRHGQQSTGWFVSAPSAHDDDEKQIIVGLAELLLEKIRAG